MMIVAKNSFTRHLIISGLALGCLTLVSCQTIDESTKDNSPAPYDTGTSQQGLTAGSSYTTADIQTAYNRAQRIRDLLANCTGAGASDAAAAADRLKQTQSVLGDVRLGIVANTQTNRDNAVEAMLNAQGDAYHAAVACGLVAPGVPDPGGWNATWDDISS